VIELACGIDLLVHWTVPPFFAFSISHLQVLCNWQIVRNKQEFFIQIAEIDPFAQFASLQAPIPCDIIDL